MKSEGMVSILVPSFNHERYITECLDSLRDQDYPFFEIIVIDDASADRSTTIVEQWIASNGNVAVRLIKGKKNLGITRRLNQLLSLSRGEFVAICASDDILTSDSISKRIDQINLQGSTACIGDAFLIDEQSKIIAHSGMQKLHYANYDKLLYDINDEIICNWSVLGPTLLAKKELFNVVGGYDENLSVEDRDMYLRIAAKKQLCFLHCEIAGYRVLRKSSSRGSISKRRFVYTEIAKANIKNAKLFSGFNQLFLSSHKLDMFLLKRFDNLFSVYAVFLIKVIRRLFFVVLKALSKT